MRTLLGGGDGNTRLIFLVPIVIVYSVTAECRALEDSPPPDLAKGALREYLVDRAEGKVTSNTWPPKVYGLMLRRLEAGKKDQKYVYLHHERMGKHVVVYWFGIDERLPGIRVRLEGGKSVEAQIPTAYRADNAKSLRSGEPQYFPIAFEDEATAKNVIHVELLHQPAEQKD